MNGIDFIIQIKISLENSLDSHQGNGKTTFAVYGNTMLKSPLPNHDEHILHYDNDAHFLGNKLVQINKLTYQLEKSLQSFFFITILGITFLSFYWEVVGGLP